MSMLVWTSQTSQLDILCLQKRKRGTEHEFYYSINGYPMRRIMKGMFRSFRSACTHTWKTLHSDIKRKTGGKRKCVSTSPFAFKCYLDMTGCTWKRKRKKKWPGEELKDRTQFMTKAKLMCITQLCVWACTCSPVWSVAGWWSPHRRRWSLSADWWPTDRSQRT